MHNGSLLPALYACYNYVILYRIALLLIIQSFLNWLLFSSFELQFIL